MADFLKAIERVLKWEGGDTYTNDPADPGGGTRYGITEATAREIGYTADMKSFPYEMAVNAYKRFYWEPLSLDIVGHQGIAEQIFQGAVNQGVGRWARFMQVACVKVLPAEMSVSIDGQVGQDTLCAIDLVILTENVAKYSRALFEMQEARYDEIILKNPALEKFKNGWHNRAVDFLIPEA